MTTTDDHYDPALPGGAGIRPMTGAAEVWEEPTEYEVCAVPKTYPSWRSFVLKVTRVRREGLDGWAVNDGFSVATYYTRADLKRDYPQGVMIQSVAFRHAVMPLDAALELARALAPKAGGMRTAAEWIAQCDARGRGESAGA